MDYDKITNELQELAKPIQEYLKENYDLETEAVIDRYTIAIIRNEVRVLSKEILNEEE